MLKRICFLLFILGFLLCLALFPVSCDSGGSNGGEESSSSGEPPVIIEPDSSVHIQSLEVGWERENPKDSVVIKGRVWLGGYPNQPCSVSPCLDSIRISMRHEETGVVTPITLKSNTRTKNYSLEGDNNNNNTTYIKDCALPIGLYWVRVYAYFNPDTLQERIGKPQAMDSIQFNKTSSMHGTACAETKFALNVTKLCVPTGTRFTTCDDNVAGTISFNPPGGSYSLHEQVSLTATENSGYKFINWADAAVGNNYLTANPYSINITAADRNITARFAESRSLVRIYDGSGNDIQISNGLGINLANGNTSNPDFTYSLIGPYLNASNGATIIEQFESSDGIAGYISMYKDAPEDAPDNVGPYKPANIDKSHKFIIRESPAANNQKDFVRYRYYVVRTSNGEWYLIMTDDIITGTNPQPKIKAWKVQN